jgi:hypothetical protein
MSLNEHKFERNYLEKLPNIVLIPWHYNNQRTPSYPLYGKREIFCGPKLQNKDIGKRKFIRTSGFFFDIEEVLSQLNKDDEKIDLIVTNLEVNTTCFPKNLSKIKSHKIALVADTHHLKHSISSIIHYLKREKFKHILKFAQPAHLHFFYEAGIKNSAFWPCFKVKFDTVGNKRTGVTYIGEKWSPFQIRRSRMVKFLEINLPKYNIPFHYYKRLPRLEWLNVLRKSQIMAICSLNGQFTPQICGCLFAGALCFVDELSPQTFLYRFFKPRKHLVTWRNFEDLLKKLIYYYHRPKKLEAIAKAGKLHAENTFSTDENYALSISEFAFENRINPTLLAINDKRCNSKRVESPEYFDARVRLYENIQELHRFHEFLSSISITNKNLKPSMDLADLPRLKITHAFTSHDLQNEADLFFQSVGVSHQIETALLNDLQKSNTHDIGILEKQANQAVWKFMVRSISELLKKNSLLWVLGELSSFEKKALRREGFKPYNFNRSSGVLKIKNLSKKICLQFWKMGMYPFPYLTLKPVMDPVPNLNVFLRGWQKYFPFLY